MINLNAEEFLVKFEEAAESSGHKLKWVTPVVVLNGVRHLVTDIVTEGTEVIIKVD